MPEARTASIGLGGGRHCPPERDGRHKAGHDGINGYRKGIYALGVKTISAASALRGAGRTARMIGRRNKWFARCSKASRIWRNIDSKMPDASTASIGLENS